MCRAHYFYPCFVSFVNHQCLKGYRRPVPINRAPIQVGESIREIFPDCYCLGHCDSLKIRSEKSVLKSCGLIRGHGLILMAVEAVSVKGTRWMQMENEQVITESTSSLSVTGEMGAFSRLKLKANILEIVFQILKHYAGNLQGFNAGTSTNKQFLIFIPTW